ncbi:hypothetical protein ACFE04_027942 [Oxalis oulophora]
MSEEGTSLEYTPTWVVAVICTLIVAISLGVERLLHLLGKYFKKNHQKSLYEALQKVKEELMLLGFISLLLTVSQNTLVKICVNKDVVNNLLPCKLNESTQEGESKSNTTSHFQRAFRVTISGTARRLLSESSSSESGYCAEKDKVPLLSLEAMHQLHIFIFVLATVHVCFCVITIFFGGLRIHQWRKWEDEIAKENFDHDQHVLKKKVTNVRQHAFIRENFQGSGKISNALGWAHSFWKQFNGSVTKADYVTLRLGFIMTHCKGSPKFNFHKYMIRALEDDFKQVVGIRQLLLAVGTKLEHVIIQLANAVAKKHVSIEGELVVKPSDHHFWFNNPRVVLFLIHFILFQNAFEIGFFFWIWVQYGFNSCIMGSIAYIIPRLVIGVFIQIFCSYSTLPIYAIVTQMGSSFKKAIFDEHIQVGLVGWANKVKKKKTLKVASNQPGSGSSFGTGHSPGSSSVAIQMGRLIHSDSAPAEIQPVPDTDGSK